MNSLAYHLKGTKNLVTHKKFSMMKIRKNLKTDAISFTNITIPFLVWPIS